MISFAAIMVVVACHPEQSSCVKEPVAVISYTNSAECRAALPDRLKALESYSLKMYGDCVPVAPDAIAQPLQKIMPAAQLRALAGESPVNGRVRAVALDQLR
ncbi:hypothetical protein [Rhizobium paknamense]|uniref:Lipoprotein n=1 Tax=Rhizobium paknamense TaxID=1206817 RepID=A0ABU0IDH5_9HYPH|nr:hypothetical protein [Rhizobium paknamense]MDQ0456301.1 hypothetical protein [Rhizobium paknamense]